MPTEELKTLRHRRDIDRRVITGENRGCATCGGDASLVMWMNSSTRSYTLGEVICDADAAHMTRTFPGLVTDIQEMVRGDWR